MPLAMSCKDVRFTVIKDEDSTARPAGWSGQEHAQLGIVALVDGQAVHVGSQVHHLNIGKQYIDSRVTALNVHAPQQELRVAYGI